jgi:hypothetical protein
VIEFNWCLDKEIPALLHHNVFLSSDYKVGGGLYTLHPVQERSVS